ncbi:MAG: malate dehydrogenase, partial [Candidatus Marinimicrobia bacterium]|nr:malate dehydrogenase [Candidatus Neomarinimicrobiota bacterium]
IGAGGIEKVIEVKLNDAEKAALKVTAEHVSGVVAETKL